MVVLVSLLPDKKFTMARFLLERMLRRLLDRIYSGEMERELQDVSWLSFQSLPNHQRKTWANFSIVTLVSIINKLRDQPQCLR